LHTAQREDLCNLYVGKTGFAYLHIITEMVERQWVSAPQFYPQYLQYPRQGESVLEYLMECIKSSEQVSSMNVVSAVA
jgi:hypothetical protein